MAEIELAAFSKQCLDRRIGDVDLLTEEVLACAHKRNLEKRTVNWTFAKQDSRKKLQRHYNNVLKLS